MLSKHWILIARWFTILKKLADVFVTLRKPGLAHTLLRLVEALSRTTWLGLEFNGSHFCRRTWWALRMLPVLSRCFFLEQKVGLIIRSATLLLPRNACIWTSDSWRSWWLDIPVWFVSVSCYGIYFGWVQLSRGLVVQLGAWKAKLRAGGFYESDGNDILPWGGALLLIHHNSFESGSLWSYNWLYDWLKGLRSGSPSLGLNSRCSWALCHALIWAKIAPSLCRCKARFSQWFILSRWFWLSRRVLMLWHWLFFQSLAYLSHYINLPTIFTTSHNNLVLLFNYFVRLNTFYNLNLGFRLRGFPWCIRFSLWRFVFILVKLIWTVNSGSSLGVDIFLRGSSTY